MHPSKTKTLLISEKEYSFESKTKSYPLKLSFWADDKKLKHNKITIVKNAFILNLLNAKI